MGNARVPAAWVRWAPPRIAARSGALQEFPGRNERHGLACLDDAERFAGQGAHRRPHALSRSNASPTTAIRSLAVQGFCRKPEMARPAKRAAESWRL